MFRFPHHFNILSFILALSVCVSCGVHKSESFGALTKSGNSPDPGQQTAKEKMITAIELDDVAAVEKILAEGFVVNSQLVRGRTALHIAVDRSRVQIVRMLFSKGADPDLKDEEGLSARDLAVGKPEIEAIFSPEVGEKLRAELIQAIQVEDKEKVSYLLVEQGLDPNFVDTTTGESPLTYAIILTFKGIVRLMLQGNINTDVNLKNKNGQSPLSLAIATQQKAVETWLRQKGAQEE